MGQPPSPGRRRHRLLAVAGGTATDGGRLRRRRGRLVERSRIDPLYVAAALFTGVLCAIVITFLILMRAGYRWARTVLTGGAIATVVYVGIRLFTVTWPPMYAVLCGVTGLTGSVLIAGGMFLLHRLDVHEYLTR